MLEARSGGGQRTSATSSYIFTVHTSAVCVGVCAWVGANGKQVKHQSHLRCENARQKCVPENLHALGCALCACASSLGAVCVFVS